jgi:N utilization substance protein B
MKGARHKAREIALQVLYEIDSVKHSVKEALDNILARIEVPEDVAGFAQELVNGVVQNREQLDQNMDLSCQPLEQISIVDRNILRIAIFEI